ncbi:MAG: hypothetical protein ACIAS6_13380 [Phycisphaerales bacterium JB060]
MVPIGQPPPDPWTIVTTVCVGMLGALLAISVLGWLLRCLSVRRGLLPPWLETRLHINAPTPAVARVLRAHEAVCTACAYPVADGPRCPECGADYAAPGAVTRRDGSTRALATVPRWLLLATVGAAACALVLLLLPVGRAAGNWIHWGAPIVGPMQYNASYRPAAVSGQPPPPAYEVILEPRLLVDRVAERRGTPGPALGGEITMWFASSPGHPTGPPHLIAYNVRTDAWSFGRFGNRANPIAPPAVTSGRGPRPAVEALFAYAGLDQAWAGSPAEMDDLEAQLVMYLDGRHNVHRARPAIPGGGHGLLASSIGYWAPGAGRRDANAFSHALGLAAIALPLLAGWLAYRRMTRPAGFWLEPT